MTKRLKCFLRTLTALALLGVNMAAYAQADDCKHRGQLDTLYCDENKDLVADPPKDPKRWKNPSTLVFTYTPVEDAAVYETAFKPFLDHLGKCTGEARRVLPGAVERRRDRGDARGTAARRRLLDGTDRLRGQPRRRGAVRHQGHREGVAGLPPDRDREEASPYQKLADLKGKKVAHTSPSSNSGHLAPQVLFPPEGPRAGQGLQGAVLRRARPVGQRRRIPATTTPRRSPPTCSIAWPRAARSRLDDFRIIYKSPTFPTSSFAYAHDLHPDFVKTLTKCFYDYRFPPEMQKTFGGADRFFPITYQKDWAVVRKVAEETGTPFNRAAYEKEAAREEARAQESGGREEVARCRRSQQRGALRRSKSAASRKEYRRGVPVLRDVDLTVARDRHHGDHRPSGTGKSTLIRCINRLVEPTAGRDPLPRRRSHAAATGASCARRGGASAWCSRNTTWSSA